MLTKLLRFLRAAITWLLSVLAIPFVAAYKALRAGVVHIFNEVDRLFLFFVTKERIIAMTLADDIATIKADVAALKAAPAPTVTVDLSTVAKADALTAVASDVTAIKADLTPTA